MLSSMRRLCTCSINAPAANCAGLRHRRRMPVLQALNLEAADAFLEVARQAYQQVGSPTCFVRGMVGLFYALCDQFDPLRNFRANR